MFDMIRSASLALLSVVVLGGAYAVRTGETPVLPETPYDDAMALARDIAGRNPGAVRGAKALFNEMFHDGAAEQFANERRVIFEQIGTPNQIEAVTAGMEQRKPNFVDV